MQPCAEFTGGYIGNYVIDMLENWETYQTALAEEQAKAAKGPKI